jgi:hypothetical protein
MRTRKNIVFGGRKVKKRRTGANPATSEFKTKSLAGVVVGLSVIRRKEIHFSLLSKTLKASSCEVRYVTYNRRIGSWLVLMYTLHHFGVKHSVSQTISILLFG